VAKSPAATAIQKKLQVEIDRIVDDDGISDETEGAGDSHGDQEAPLKGDLPACRDEASGFRVLAYPDAMGVEVNLHLVDRLQVATEQQEHGVASSCRRRGPR
jgi:hypothetical protein